MFIPVARSIAPNAPEGSSDHSYPGGLLLGIVLGAFFGESPYRSMVRAWLTSTRRRRGPLVRVLLRPVHAAEALPTGLGCLQELRRR